MIYDKGEVLEINIKGTLTNCIVIDHKKECRFIIGDKMLRYQYEHSSLNKDTLKRENHNIYVFVTNSKRIFYDCHHLLAGDKKIWICAGFREDVDYPLINTAETQSF